MTLLETYFELPHQLEVAYPLLGRDFMFAVDGVDITIRFPRAEDSPNWPLLVAPSFTSVFADDGLSDILLKDLEWGAESDHNADNPESGLGVVTTVGLTTVCDPGTEQDFVERLSAAMKVWWPGVCDWIEVLTRQVHGIHARELLFGPYHPVWGDPGGAVKRLFPATSRRVVREVNSGPDAYLLLTDKLLEAAVSLAAAGPPELPWLLIRDARVAHKSSATRRAVLDAGTATELAITKLLRDRLPDLTDAEFEAKLKKHQMLGKRKALLEVHGGVLPANTQEHLIDRRNLAAHQGTNISTRESYQALMIAIAIVEDAYPVAPHREDRRSTL